MNTLYYIILLFILLYLIFVFKRSKYEIKGQGVEYIIDIDFSLATAHDELIQTITFYFYDSSNILINTEQKTGTVRNGNFFVFNHDSQEQFKFLLDTSVNVIQINFTRYQGLYTYVKYKKNIITDQVLAGNIINNNYGIIINKRDIDYATEFEFNINYHDEYKSIVKSTIFDFFNTSGQKAYTIERDVDNKNMNYTIKLSEPVTRVNIYYKDFRDETFLIETKETDEMRNPIITSIPEFYDKSVDCSLTNVYTGNVEIRQNDGRPIFEMKKVYANPRQVDDTCYDMTNLNEISYTQNYPENDLEGINIDCGISISDPECSTRDGGTVIQKDIEIKWESMGEGKSCIQVIQDNGGSTYMCPNCNYDWKYSGQRRARTDFPLFKEYELEAEYKVSQNKQECENIFGILENIWTNTVPTSNDNIDFDCEGYWSMWSGCEIGPNSDGEMVDSSRVWTTTGSAINDGNPCPNPNVERKQCPNCTPDYKYTGEYTINKAQNGQFINTTYKKELVFENPENKEICLELHPTIAQEIQTVVPPTDSDGVDIDCVGVWDPPEAPVCPIDGTDQVQRWITHVQSVGNGKTCPSENILTECVDCTNKWVYTGEFKTNVYDAGTYFDLTPGNETCVVISTASLTGGRRTYTYRNDNVFEFYAHSIVNGMWNPPGLNWSHPEYSYDDIQAHVNTNKQICYNDCSPEFSFGVNIIRLQINEYYNYGAVFEQKNEYNINSNADLCTRYPLSEYPQWVREVPGHDSGINIDCQGEWLTSTCTREGGELDSTFEVHIPQIGSGEACPSTTSTTQCPDCTFKWKYTGNYRIVEKEIYDENNYVKLWSQSGGYPIYVIDGIINPPRLDKDGNPWYREHDSSSTIIKIEGGYRYFKIYVNTSEFEQKAEYNTYSGDCSDFPLPTPDIRWVLDKPNENNTDVRFDCYNIYDAFDTENCTQQGGATPPTILRKMVPAINGGINCSYGGSCPDCTHKWIYTGMYKSTFYDDNNYIEVEMEYSSGWRMGQPPTNNRFIIYHPDYNDSWKIPTIVVTNIKINGIITSNNDYDIIYELGSEKDSHDWYGTNIKFTKRFEIKYKNPVYEEIKVYTYPENESLCTNYPIGTPKNRWVYDNTVSQSHGKTFLENYYDDNSSKVGHIDKNIFIERGNILHLLASYGYDTIKINQNDCVGYWETGNCMFTGKREHKWITTNVQSGNGKTCAEISNHTSTTKQVQDPNCIDCSKDARYTGNVIDGNQEVQWFYVKNANQCKSLADIDDNYKLPNNGEPYIP